MAFTWNDVVVVYMYSYVCLFPPCSCVKEIHSPQQRNALCCFLTSFDIVLHRVCLLAIAMMCIINHTSLTARCALLPYITVTVVAYVSRPTYLDGIFSHPSSNYERKDLLK